MSARIWISEIKFNDGTILKLEKNDIVVFVGPNNAGKSVSLRQIANQLMQTQLKQEIIEKITIETIGTLSDLQEHLKGISVDKSQFDSGNFNGFRFNVYIPHEKDKWDNPNTTGLNSLYHVFANTLNTEQRLSAANPAKSIKITSDVPQHPIHFLQKDPELEKFISNLFRQAFGTDLIVHRNAGSEVPLYVGEKPILENNEDRVSISYLKKLEKLDLLQRQGDGMRSFVGVMLNTFISDYSILFIDEPEAFLHPPQARLLGKMLSLDLQAERQLFLATHSENFLKGLLETKSSNLKVVRIQRNGKTNRINVLNSNDILEIWEDSLLRHSNVLDGLFHSRVIICESDSDAQFFSALISAEFEKSRDIAPDLLFISCGGKHRIPVAIKALKKLDVDIRVIVDFDVLSDINPLKSIIEGLHGDWKNFEQNWKTVKTQIEQKKPELTTEDVKKEIENILSKVSDRVFPSKNSQEIQKVLRKTSAWSIAKEVGKAFIPSGEASKAFDDLQNKTKNLGLNIIEVGELEGFVKSIGNHGPKWVSEVLTKDLKNDPELQIARDFIIQVIK
jgi:energy-coupling factor transporter ATP-binding protein EcfA2